MCLRDIPLHMWKTLHRELRVPPRKTAEDDCTLSGVKIWLLTNPSASWQVFAMALYVSRLDGALKELKNLNLLPHKGKIAALSTKTVPSLEMMMSWLISLAK